MGVYMLDRNIVIDRDRTGDMPFRREPRDSLLGA